MPQKRKRVRTVKKKVEPKKEGPVENTQAAAQEPIVVSTVTTPDGTFDILAKKQEYATTQEGVCGPVLDLTSTVRKVEPVDPPAKPQYQIDHPDWKWDRLCTKCGGKTMMEAPKVYNIEVFECQNKKCRAQFTVETFYDRRGKFTHEEFKGMTLGPLS